MLRRHKRIVNEKPLNMPAFRRLLIHATRFTAFFMHNSLPKAQGVLALDGFSPTTEMPRAASLGLKPAGMPAVSRAFG
jgi:hypothetical protein